MDQTTNDKQQDSRELTTWDISRIKAMIIRGDRQHDIAALFGQNPGRIAEIKNGMAPPTGKTERGRDVAVAEPHHVPPPGPYFQNMISAVDIVQDGLEACTEPVAMLVATDPVKYRDLQRRFHSAIAERKRELWAARQR